MSANDPTPFPGPDAIRPDVRQITSDVPAVEPAPSAPPRPHPGFWWSVLWCIGFVLVTQIPGAIIAA